MTKIHKAFNTNLIFSVGLFFLFVFGTIISWIRDEFISMAGLLVLNLVWLFEIATTPLYTVFTEESIVIVYVIGYKETIIWNNIKTINLECGLLSRVPDYVISYEAKKSKPFFASGKIPKSKKTQELFGKYWKRKILD